MKEKEIEFLEKQIPNMSVVFQLKGIEMLERGYSIVESDEKGVYELYPNGDKKYIAPTKVVEIKQTKAKLKW